MLSAVATDGDPILCTVQPRVAGNAALRGQHAPFQNVYEPGSRLFYHYAGDAHADAEGERNRYSTLLEDCAVKSITPRLLMPVASKRTN